MNKRPNRVVPIVGSGASFHTGIPMLSGLMPAIYALEESRETLNSITAVASPGEIGDIGNVEDVLSFLESQEASAPEDSDRYNHFANLRADLIELVTKVIVGTFRVRGRQDVGHQFGTAYEAHKFFASRLYELGITTAVTYNYDLHLELGWLSSDISRERAFIDYGINFEPYSPYQNSGLDKPDSGKGKIYGY